MEYIAASIVFLLTFNALFRHVPLAFLVIAGAVIGGSILAATFFPF